MTPSTCPNTKCKYDNQLEEGQMCPQCGSEAKEFKFNDFGALLKQKEEEKRLLNLNQRFNRSLIKAKFCPKCGSPNLHFLIYYRPSIWKCFDCDYEGAFVLEGHELAGQIREQYKEENKQDKHV